MCARFENVILMQKKSILLEGIRILGTTLWSNVPDFAEPYVSFALNDYSKIKIKDSESNNSRLLTVKDTNQFFSDESEWIKTEIKKAEQNKEKVLVLTHHSPILDGLDPKYKDDVLNYAFVSDLEYLFGNSIHTWCFGHTHYCVGKKRNKKNTIINKKK